MYNQFNEEELRTIEWVLDYAPRYINSEAKNNLENVKKKIKEELYPNESFIKYITKNNKNILKIYKNKKESNYEIIIKDCSTKMIYKNTEIIFKYFNENPDIMFDFMFHDNDENVSLFINDLVYEKKEI